MKKRYLDKLDIDGKVCIVTGGGGLLGMKHTEAILEGGGIPVLLDISRGGGTTYQVPCGGRIWTGGCSRGF